LLLSSGVRLGPYEILSPLGAGGMGEFYRAKEGLGVSLSKWYFGSWSPAVRGITP
jgi:hypothetical protein